MDVVVTLTDEQLDALADRIAARLSASPPCATSNMVDAATLAAHLGVARSYVYTHASELGGKRLGGPRGRLRFDLAIALAAWATANPEPELPRHTNRRRKQAALQAGSILKVRG